MVMVIIHIAHITCLVTNDAWHAYGVIVVAGLVGSHISRNRPYCGWLVRLWARSEPVAVNGAIKIVVG